MKQLKVKALAIGTLTILAINLYGCSNENGENLTENEPSPEIASILEDYPDIYIPSQTEWERSLYSGSVEQHEIKIPVSNKEDLYEDLKTEMTNFEWTLFEESEGSIRFTKGDLLVSYNSKSNQVETGKIAITLFIEPKSLYE